MTKDDFTKDDFSYPTSSLPPDKYSSIGEAPNPSWRVTCSWLQGTRNGMTLVPFSQIKYTHAKSIPNRKKKNRIHHKRVQYENRYAWIWRGSSWSTEKLSHFPFPFPLFTDSNLFLHRFFWWLESDTVCTCLISFQSNVHLPRFHFATMQVGTSCKRCTWSKISWDIWQISCEDLKSSTPKEPKVLKEARHCESVLRASFPFRSSAGEMQAKWPVDADTHGHPCSIDAKSFASPQLVRTRWPNLWLCGNGDDSCRQTDRQTDLEIKRCGPTRVRAKAFMHLSHEALVKN